ncbi:hypothetical protein B4080_1067 [Bacillus cereus]|nr:hypothetical protein B4080_1067 [Bacillus cereus]
MRNNQRELAYYEGQAFSGYREKSGLIHISVQLQHTCTNTYEKR